MTEPNNDASQSRPYLVRIVLARPRLTMCFLLGLAATLLLPETVTRQAITRAIIGWNTGACLYLVLAARMMFWSNHERMRQRAVQRDKGRVLVLILVVTAAVACIGAIVAELAVVKELKGAVRYGHIAVAAFTIVSPWAFTQVMFALHYAHHYYLVEAGGAHGGLDFPGGHARGRQPMKNPFRAFLFSAATLLAFPAAQAQTLPAGARAGTTVECKDGSFASPESQIRSVLRTQGHQNMVRKKRSEVGSCCPIWG